MGTERVGDREGWAQRELGTERDGDSERTPLHANGNAGDTYAIVKILVLNFKRPTALYKESYRLLFFIRAPDTTERTWHRNRRNPRKAFAQNIEHCQHHVNGKGPVPSRVLCSALRQPYGSFIDIKIVACTLLRLRHEVRLNLEATKRALIWGPLPIRILTSCPTSSSF